MPAPGDALIEGLAARGHAVVRDAIPGDVVAGLRDRASLARPRRRLRAGRRGPRRGAHAAKRRSRRSHRMARRGLRRPAERAVAALARGVARCGATATSCSGSRTSKRTTRSTRRARATPVIAIAFATTTRACSRACSTSMTAWTAGDGGALRLYTPDRRDRRHAAWRHVRRVPVGRLRARGAAGARERLALAGWFRRRVLV